MRLTLFNGSPRGKKSNTRILLDHFTQGFMEARENQSDIHYLFREEDRDEHVASFGSAENVIIAFPLYTDAMPGLVKAFIEALEIYCGRDDNPALGFMVQSGFSEAVHSRYVERYLEKLSSRLGCRYLGTAVRGGGEGIQVMPPWMTRKLFRLMNELGRTFSERGFNPDRLRRLARRERMTPLGRFIFRVMKKTGMADWYWNDQLKKNGAYDRRFARPLE